MGDTIPSRLGAKRGGRRATEPRKERSGCCYENTICGLSLRVRIRCWEQTTTSDIFRLKDTFLDLICQEL